MATKKRESSFRGKVASNAQRTASTGGGSNYLRAPKGISFFNPEPEGTVKLDFIPYVVTDEKHPDRDAQEGTAVEGSLWYRRPYRRHSNVGAGNGDSVVCLSSFGKKCPICEHRAKMQKEGAPKEDLKPLNSSKRNLYIVIPKGSKKYEEVPHIFDISDFLFQELLTKELKENPDFEIFPDLHEGLTLKIRFEPGSMTTAKPYPEANRIDFLERDEEYDDSLLDDIPSLDDMLTQLSYKELEAKFLEIDDEDMEPEDKPIKSKSKFKPVDDNEDIEEAPKERVAKKISKPAPDEEEEKPVRRSVRKPIIIEEEEDEPAPVKKPAKKPIIVEEEEETPPVKKPIAKSSKKVCPHKLKFGVDAEQYDVCDTCDIWSECVAEKEKNE